MDTASSPVASSELSPSSPSYSFSIHEYFHTLHQLSGYHPLTSSSISSTTSTMKSSSSSSLSTTSINIYLKYLTNKLYKTRKNIISVHSSPTPVSGRGNKSSTSSNTTPSSYPVTLELCSSNINYFYILLLYIEKYYTKSLYYKSLLSSSSSNPPPSSSSSTLSSTNNKNHNHHQNSNNNKFLMNIRKNYKKILKYCDHLQQYCQVLCDESTILESQALIHWFYSNYYFIQENWKKCYENSLKSFTIYKELVLLGFHSYPSTTGSIATSTGGSRTNLKDIYQLYLQNLIPTIRFCRYNLGIMDEDDEGFNLENETQLVSGTTSSSSSSTTRNESLIKLFSNDPEMLNKLEIIRLKSLSKSVVDATTTSEESNDPILTIFNSIIWCNHPILLPSTSSTSAVSSSSSSGLSSQHQNLISTLHDNCGKLISFLELQHHQNQQNTNTNEKKNSTTSIRINSLYLPQETILVGSSSSTSMTNTTATAPTSSSSTHMMTHYLTLLQDIINNINQLLNTLPSSILAISTPSNRLSKESLTYLRQYFLYLQYYTQYQQGVLLLNQLQHDKNSTSTSSTSSSSTNQYNINEIKLNKSQEKCHLCDQIMRNIDEIMKIIEGTSSTTLPVATAITAVPDSEESHEDILLLSFRSSHSIFRTYRLLYLAECYTYYGLVSSSTAPPTSSNTTSDEGTSNGTGEGVKNILKLNLEKASALLEYADEVMNNDVYNFIENYSASISSTALISSSLEILQIHLKTLEDLITGSKTRILAFYSLATLPSSSSNMELSSSSIISTLSSPPSLSSPHHNTSMVRNPNQWISLNSSIPQTNTTKLPQGKNKLKTNKISESDKKTLIIQPIPPLFEPIPCKPIFYDIALNYLELHVNDVLDTRCGVKKSNKMKSNTSSNSLSTSSPSPSSAATGGLVGAAASWLGWFSGSK